MSKRPSFATLAKRILCAKAKAVDAVKSVARTCADGRELWERLAARAVIPQDWIDDPRRQFVARLPEEGGAARARIEPSSTPSLEAAITLAADAPAITTAEALAREVTQGLSSWRVQQPQLVRWWVASDVARTRSRKRLPPVSPIVSRTPLVRAFRALTNAAPPNPRLARTVSADGVRDAATAARCADALVWQLAEDVRAAKQWDIAVEDGWVYNGVGFEQLSCPFRPLLALWATGYVLVSIDEAAVTLAARQL